jgi:circadian clock protein KaiC
MDRVRTGIEGLDQLLCGGFLRGDAVLVAGAPGTGKTSLGMQYLYNGITQYREPGLFITFEEFPERIYRDAASFGWDFRALEEQGKLKVLFTSPEVLQQDVVRDQGLVSEMVAEMRASRVVVDSISLLEDGGGDAHQFREAVYGLINALKRESLTALLIRELRDVEEIGRGPEEFVADGVVLLTRKYVAGQHMRFVEVMKSRGSPHLAMPSLFFLTETGLRVLPPFQEPFYRFEEAVSTGISQLDDLLGGGIPYGAFYLIEADGELHQDIFDASFAREALETGDHYLRLAGPSDEKSRWRALMASAGMEARIQEGMEGGQVTFLSPEGEEIGGWDAEALCAKLKKLCGQQVECPLRIQVDISRLFTLMPPGEGYRVFLKLITHCRQKKAVVLGVMNPRAVPEEQMERIRSAAEGIVRVWTEGSYSYLQVVKTVNSARTPVYAINPTPHPPFVEIMTY